MHKVLILPIGTEVGLEIYRALRYSKHFEIYGVSSNDNNHGRFVCKNYIKENIPRFNHYNFWEEVSKIAEKYRIDFIYPASPMVFDNLHFIPKKLNKKLILSNRKTVDICRSKAITYQTFKDSLCVPEPRSTKFPIFMKPDRGQGTTDCYVANNKHELDAFRCLVKDYLLLEYIRGPEYTVDCFTDRFGELQIILSRVRNRIKNGISVNTSIVDNKQFKPIAKIINKKLKMRGGWFFQVKGHDKLYLLEIEPRIAGTSGIWRQMGINLPLLTLYDRLEQDVVIDPLDLNVELDRALRARYKVKLSYDHVYIDLDDTLILNKKLNLDLIKFLYQCQNNKKKIYLITRNAFVLDQLANYNIHQGLFEEVIVSMNDSKSKLIKHFPAIFIDDSFGERQEVKKIGVPVFDLDAVECLNEG